MTTACRSATRFSAWILRMNAPTNWKETSSRQTCRSKRHSYSTRKPCRSIQKVHRLSAVLVMFSNSRVGSTKHYSTTREHCRWTSISQARLWLWWTQSWLAVTGITTTNTSITLSKLWLSRYKTDSYLALILSTYLWWTSQASKSLRLRDSTRNISSREHLKDWER